MLQTNRFYYWHWKWKWLICQVLSFWALNWSHGAVKSVSVASGVRAWRRSLSLSSASFISHLDHSDVEALGWRRGGAVSRGTLLLWSGRVNVTDLSLSLCLSLLGVGVKPLGSALLLLLFWSLFEAHITRQDFLFWRLIGSIEWVQVHNSNQPFMSSPWSFRHRKQLEKGFLYVSAD